MAVPRPLALDSRLKVTFLPSLARLWISRLTRKSVRLVVSSKGNHQLYVLPEAMLIGNVLMTRRQ
jgi:hypothetical protein